MICDVVEDDESQFEIKNKKPRHLKNGLSSANAMLSVNEI